MGSPYLLAHGLGKPVADASTTIIVATAGHYEVWVRAKDWVPTHHPGRFELSIDGRRLDTVFGANGRDWSWQSAGVVALSQGPTTLTLHDLTGFEGRCDALYFSADGLAPPQQTDDGERAWRRRLRGLPAHPLEVGEFDVVVVGGGVSGCAAALAAARLGQRVALIQDRPVLGGNSSSEVRVWPEGHVNQEPWPRIGDVVTELVPERRADSKNAQGAHVFDDARKLQIVRAEPNITLLLEHRMNAAAARDGLVRHVVCEDVRTARRLLVPGRWFADCTGDGCLGFLVGADFEQTDTGHMGASNLWNIQCLCEDEEPLSSELQAACAAATFPRCPWAVDLRDKPFPGRTSGSTAPQPVALPISLGNWFWESGFDRDPIADMERIRDQNFRAMYGAWDAIKNVEQRYPAHRLNWVAYVAGKRESRRLLGDVVLTGEDLRDGKIFADGCFPCTWGIDTHHPNAKYAAGHDGDEFIADFTHGEGYVYQGPYWAPYRCLYSRNVGNLFMAGRDISVTHEALGAVRVMKTTGAMGEIVGMAAAVCLEQDCTPREVYTQHLDALQAKMRAGAGRQIVHGLQLPARGATLAGASLRYEADRDCLGWWRAADDVASWRLRAPAAGRYRVLADYACAPDDSDGAVQVLLDGAPAGAASTILATDSWQEFVARSVAVVELDDREHTLSLRGVDFVGALWKLRGLRLERTE
ncbi:MAG: FAD-dependent oxidoreductase [Planctomycetes bacterium]|nr:FAD-dependent oxidoreductase [Planctomycetota bacterium]